MTATCACSQPAHDGFLCHTCTRDLQLALAWAAILGPQLDIARSRQARFAEHHGSGSDPHRLPVDLRAMAAADALAAVLAEWIWELGIATPRATV